MGSDPQRVQENKNSFIPKSAHYDFVALRNAGYSKQQILDCANNGTEKNFDSLRNAGHDFSMKIINKYLKQV